VVLTGLGVFVVATVLLWVALGLPAAPGPETRLNVVKIALSVVAGVDGVVALVVAYRRQRIGEVAEARERVKVLNERFASACAQIGHEKPTVRLAGMYAMAGLADEWAEQRQVCIDVLCAYLRIPYEPALDSPWYHDEETEVRFSITSMLSDRLRPGAPVSWQGHEFNLLRAVLHSADFADIQVTGGRLLFSLARFPGGWTSFEGVHVSGGEVSFRGARFTGGEVDLCRAGSDDYTRPPVFDPGETPPPGLLLPGA
jgi:hypothetical protein